MQTSEKMPYGMTGNSDRMVRARDQLASDFGTLVSDAEELLRSTASYSGEAVGSARERLKGTLEHFKGRVGDAQRAMAGRIDHAVTTTDAYVHDNPWNIAGVAAAVGFIIGALLLHRK